MAKDINIHLKARGAAETKQQLDKVGESTKKVGDKADQGGRKGAKGIDKLTDSAKTSKGFFGKFTTSISSWVTGLVGITAVIAGITKAIRIQSEFIKEHARIASEQQKKLLALQAMGTFFEEHPEIRKEIAAYAEFGRRPIPEVTEAWYALESKGAGLTEQQKRGIMTEALELGRMEPEADLKGIIEMFSLYAKETRQKDINLIQNVLRATMTKAGAELAEVGKYLPEFQPLGIAAGLTGAEAAGLWAYATTRAKEPGRATVGLRNIFTALLGKGTPESKELLQRLGITPEMDFFKQMAQLSAQQKAGRFGVPEAELIAGRESVAILLSMLTDPEAMMATVREVSAAARPDIDIVRDRLKQIMGQDEIARLEEERRRFDVIISGIKGRDVRALRWDVALKKYETRMRKAGVSELAIHYQLWKYGTISGLGAEPGPSWLGEPFGEFPEFPRQGPPIIINDNKRIFNPVVGVNKEDLGMGSVVPRNIQ